MHRTATVSRFERSGLSLVVPEGTDVLCEQPLVLAVPAAAGGRARYVLERRSVDASLDRWLSEQMAGQLRLLELPLVLSQDRCEVFGSEGWRTLLQHAVEGWAVTVVQWWTVVDGYGVVASGSCRTPQFDLLLDTFREIQEGVRFDEG